jgi:hypothetical protein
MDANGRSSKWTGKFLLKVFLLGVVPLATLGFNVFEGTSIYAWLVGVRGVERALTTKLTTQYGEAHRMFIDPRSSPEEFNHLWALARRYSSAILPDAPPLTIARLAIENGAFVEVPNRGRVILIPDSAPIFAVWCPESELAAKKCKETDAIMLGTVSDVREWSAKRSRAVHSTIDLIVTVLSIVLGLTLELKPGANN